MDMGSIAAWVAVAVSLAAIVITRVTDRSKAHAAKISAIEDRLDLKADKNDVSAQVTGVMARGENVAMRVDVVEDRMTKCEAYLDHLPDKDATMRLELGLQDLRGEMKVLAERIKPVAAISERLQEAMLEKVGH